MFHPVGSQPPSVYWRRRLLVVGSIVLLIVLLVLTVKVAAGGDTKTNGGGGPTPPPTHPAATSPNTSTPPPSTTQPRTSAPASSTRAKSTAPTTPPPSPCVAKDLAVNAVVGQDSYSVGDDPVLELQVTNTGAKPCVQDLADKQIVLSVYNGESRVWGSHDCQIQPGTDPKTLAVNTPVRVAINWSGLTSQPKCAGTRQRVGAGTYTLYATLSGKTGHATQFTIN
jgi:hypothetical protein